ncbi:MAG TPA: hypothetical protein VMW52_11905 [Phycisphaerae bacterium]|nr:hypothetical protein [Phycisphaerae bacterium]
MGKIGKAKLAALVDQLGTLRAKIGNLKGAESLLTAQVREAMQAGELVTVEAQCFVAQLNWRSTLTIDAAKFRRKFGEEVFAACAKIDNKLAKAALPDADLAKYGGVTVAPDLRVSARK